MKTLLINDKVWELVVADGRSNCTRAGRDQIQRVVAPQLKDLEVQRHLGDTDTDIPVGSGTPIYKENLKIPPAGKTFIVVAKVVTNPGAKLISTRDVKLYCNKGELSLTGKEFETEEAARHAIKSAIQQEKVILYNRNGAVLAKSKGIKLKK